MDSLKKLLSGKTPVLIDFFATWCGPCKAIHPVLEKLKKEVGERLHVLKVDIDKSANRVFTEQHQVLAVPTLVLYKDGMIVWRQSGALSLSQLEEIVRQYA